MTEIIFWIIIGIISVNFIVEKWLDIINLRHTFPEPPKPLGDVFDKEEYRKSQLYKKANTRFSFISGTFSFLLTEVFLKI